MKTAYNIEQQVQHTLAPSMPQSTAVAPGNTSSIRTTTLFKSKIGRPCKLERFLSISPDLAGYIHSTAKQYRTQINQVLSRKMSDEATKVMINDINRRFNLQEK